METPALFTPALFTPALFKLDKVRLRGTLRRTCAILAAAFLPGAALAQTAFTWQQIKDKFEAANPTLKAAPTQYRRIPGSRNHGLSPSESLRDRDSRSDESIRAQSFSHIAADGLPAVRLGTNSVYQFSYLHERDHKRELRLRQAPGIPPILQCPTSKDQERGLVFNLRSAFVQSLQAKAVLQNAKENLEYWDHELEIFRDALPAPATSRKWT